MGDIIGGIGSIIGGNTAANAEKQGAQTALTGYNYLSSNPLIAQTQGNASSAEGSQNQQLAGEAGTVGNISQLLSGNGTNSQAFQNYLNSTGYQFQTQQGTDAITQNAASKGLLNSGATAKALQTYGQGTAAQTFNNYLGQLGTTAQLQGQTAAGYGGQVAQGLGAAQSVGSAGTTGGANAGNLQGQAGQSLGTSYAQAGNVFGGMPFLNTGVFNGF